MSNVTDVASTTEVLTSTPTSQKPVITTATPTSTTTLTPEELCGKHNTSCDDCLGVSGAKCLWCKSDSSCKPYPYSKVLPSAHECALSEARWGVCWLNFEALIIAVSVIGGVIVLTITCCCIYCCCCRGNNQKKYDKDQHDDEQKLERKAKQDERRAERQSRLDEIRRKYGLMKDDAPYQRFDA
ncbi:LOW QUALITY PROTEIN: pituitary tumor-transforming gene 1 protein-interacting protein-like [Pomacea canaliculata]|uniref:LOW QUALITY PROTEIN: pituitary tumor-transforming gene 1 protein-interacting protein-like n=1 Tax=Pomacea canaliculata TaxID=400727 RepID=UPI000D73C0CA|nr:LOW QUALITY PROTEIN: pituitary tumor-transforming gene 1 protein-interacting protein-like [Pomacea canaliculata]